MALYFTSNTNMTTPTQQNLSSSSKTMTGVCSKAAASGITLSRAFIYEFEVGANGTPNATDCAIEWDAVACTTTGTAVTCFSNPLDPADTAASHDSFINHTAEGTTAVTSQRWQLSANQRAQLSVGGQPWRSWRAGGHRHRIERHRHQGQVGYLRLDGNGGSLFPRVVDAWHVWLCDTDRSVLQGWACEGSRHLHLRALQSHRACEAEGAA